MNAFNSKHLVVTGGGGFLGSAVVRKLISKGYRVSSFSRHFHECLKELGVDQLQGDLTDAKAVTEAFKGAGAVFHVAAKPGIWGAFDDYWQVNVKGTENVIAACFENQVGQLIYTSSPSVIFNGKDMENVDESTPYPEKYPAPYPETKAMAEQRVRQAVEKGLHAIILRPHLIWGPGDNHLVPGIVNRAGRLRQVGRSDDRVDFVYVDNAADAHILALEKLRETPSLSGNVYFISQGDPVSKWEMADAFLRAAGKPPIKGRMSARTAYVAGALFEFVYRFLKIRKEPPLTRFAAGELATSHWFDISRARKDLGYDPKISTREGLERLKQWFEQKGEMT